MCGLKPKLKLLDFKEFIQKYKLIFLTETKLDELDDVTVPNYKIFTNNRKIKRRASGGVAVLVHNSLSVYITVLDTDIKSTIWIRLDKRIKCRNNYRRQQSVENLNLVRKSSTTYKKIVHKAYTEYKRKIIHKLRLLENY